MTVSNIILKFSAKRADDPREGARKAFQAYRKHLESDRYNHVECISCGRIIHSRDAKGGYYINTEECAATEFESDNMWMQCPYCLSSLNGNRANFEKRLIARIGVERVNRLNRIRMASKGDKKALLLLSKEDRLKALSQHNRSFYEYKRGEYDVLSRLFAKNNMASSI